LIITVPKLRYLSLPLIPSFSIIVWDILNNTENSTKYTQLYFALFLMLFLYSASQARVLSASEKIWLIGYYAFSLVPSKVVEGAKKG